VLERLPAQSDNRCGCCGPPTIRAFRAPPGIPQAAHRCPDRSQADPSAHQSVACARLAAPASRAGHAITVPPRSVTNSRRFSQPNCMWLLRQPGKDWRISISRRLVSGYDGRCATGRPVALHTRSPQWGQNPNLPHCNSHDRFTSISGHWSLDIGCGPMIWHRWRTAYADATSHRLVIAYTETGSIT
jgi:hypothetical protein